MLATSHKDGDYSELEELSEELNEQGAACGEGAIG